MRIQVAAFALVAWLLTGLGSLGADGPQCEPGDDRFTTQIPPGTAAVGMLVMGDVGIGVYLYEAGRSDEKVLVAPGGSFPPSWPVRLSVHRDQAFVCVGGPGLAGVESLWPWYFEPGA